MIPPKMLKRIEHLESAQSLIQTDLVEVKGDVNTIMTNHLPHLQAALNHLILKSWIGLGSELAILVTALLTLYSIMKR